MLTSLLLEPNNWVGDGVARATETEHNGGGGGQRRDAAANAATSRQKSSFYPEIIWPLNTNQKWSDLVIASVLMNSGTISLNSIDRSNFFSNHRNFETEREIDMYRIKSLDLQEIYLDISFFVVYLFPFQSYGGLNDQYL